MKLSHWILLLLIFGIPLSTNAQVVTSGKSAIYINNLNTGKVPEKESADTNITFRMMNEMTAQGKNYALIIGINNYQDPLISNLDNPIEDATKLYVSLTSRYAFEDSDIVFLKDATMSEIVKSLDEFASKVKPQDNFLLFYAGHGHWNPSSELGYWLPADATRNSSLNWFRNSTLRDYLREIKSRHTLLITDACFAGAIFKTRSAFADAPLAINKLYELPSRKAMTSGTLTEVPDKSAFIKYLVERLDSNNEKYLSSEQLFSSFRIAVINNSSVVPQYGEIREVGDQGGDFIFVLKDKQ